MLARGSEVRIDWHFIARSKRLQNGLSGSRNGRMRDELLNETLFMCLDHPRTAITAWMVYYGRNGPAPPSPTKPRRRPPLN